MSTKAVPVAAILVAAIPP